MLGCYRKGESFVLFKCLGNTSMQSPSSGVGRADGARVVRAASGQMGDDALTVLQGKLLLDGHDKSNSPAAIQKNNYPAL